MYKVYLHTCPNGKYYVGQTRNPYMRWTNGNTYSNNRAFHADIKKYGWDNIKHEIIYECETRGEAESMEKLFTVLLDSENPDKGYNNTRICAHLCRCLDKRYEYRPTRAEMNEVKYANNSEASNPFEVSDISVSEAEKIIDDWIYNDLHRTLLKDRFLNGMSFPDMGKKYGMSQRQLKRIVYDGKAQIELHI